MEKNSIFNINDVDDKIELLRNSINVPYLHVYKSTLGGAENVSILCTISLDDKSNWKYGIFENSRYMKFHIKNNGVIEQFTKQYTITSAFRKSTVKDFSKVIQKINDYLSKIQKGL